MLRILDITAPDINNGNGCRVTLWVSGCTHHCKGCHNEWTWDFTKGKSLVENQDEILNELSNWLSKYYIEGITFSGGDPLCQDDDGLYELKMLIMWVRRNFPTKNIWLYTGYIYDNLPGKKKEIYGDFKPTILIPCGLEMGGGREFTLVLSCDVIIARGGGSGTLTEMAIAYQAGIPIITIDKFTGWAKKLSNTYFDDRKRLKCISVNTPEEAIDLAIKLGGE